MKKFLLLAFYLFSTIVFSQSQKDNSEIEISILTIAPGASLNDAFGHSAYRVKTRFKDDVYNYGVFDFKTPNFYTKFAQGKLNYSIGKNKFEDFKNAYIRQNRSIKEQVLNLTHNQKKELYNFLIQNNKPENRLYLYDFFYDNCATKIRDVAEQVLDGNINYGTPEVYKNETFRELIQNNLEWNSWGSMGINIALGSVIDRETKPYEYMFLPENIFQFFEKARFKDSEEPLVKSSKTIFKQRELKPQSSFITSPLFVLSLLSLIIIVLTYFDYKKGKRTLWLDASIFAITGIIGIVILLLWFATDHTATAQNYNVLWAFPFSLLFIHQVLKKQPKKWFVAYMKFLVIALCLLTLHWIVGVQRFALVLIPLLVALLVRYLFVLRFYKIKSA